jgi:hypothetical protein
MYASPFCIIKKWRSTQEKSGIGWFLTEKCAETLTEHHADGGATSRSTFAYADRIPPSSPNVSLKKLKGNLRIGRSLIELR